MFLARDTSLTIKPGQGVESFVALVGPDERGVTGVMG